MRGTLKGERRLVFGEEERRGECSGRGQAWSKGERELAGRGGTWAECGEDACVCPSWVAGRAKSGVAQNVAEELRLEAQLTEQNDQTVQSALGLSR